MTRALGLFLPWMNVPDIVCSLYRPLADTYRAIVIDVHDWVRTLIRVLSILPRLLGFDHYLLADTVLILSACLVFLGVISDYTLLLSFFYEFPIGFKLCI